MTGTFALYWRGAGHFFVWSFVLYHSVGLLFAGSQISFSRKIQFMAQKKSPQGLWHVCGADEGSRTLLSSLGSWRSTDELHPHTHMHRWYHTFQKISSVYVKVPHGREWLSHFDRKKLQLPFVRTWGAVERALHLMVPTRFSPNPFLLPLLTLQKSIWKQ